MVKLAISEGRDSKVFWEGHLDLKKKKREKEEDYTMRIVPRVFPVFETCPGFYSTEHRPEVCCG